MSYNDQIEIEIDQPMATLAGTIVKTPAQEDGFGFQFCVPYIDYADTDYFVNPLWPILQLRPLQLRDDWQTTVTGNYARLTMAHWWNGSTDLTGTWQEINPVKDGNIFLSPLNNHSTIYTLRSYPANQTFVVTFLATGHKSDRFRMIQIAFGDYQLNVYSNGELVMVDNSNVQVAKGKIARSQTQYLTNQFVTLLIQPMLNNNILVYCPSHGGGFRYTDFDIDPLDNESIITAAGHLRIRFPDSQGMVQAMHAVYPNNATFTTPIRTLAKAPPAGSNTSFDPLLAEGLWWARNDTRIDADMIEHDSDTLLTWDGTKRQYRIKYKLFAYNGSLDGGENPDGRPNWTPFVSGAKISLPGEYETKDADSQDVTDYVRSFRLSYNGGRDGVTGNIELNDADLHAGGHQSFPSKRLVYVTIGSDIVFAGLTKNPMRTESPNSKARHLRFELSSIMKERAERTRFFAFKPFDGMLVTDVVRELFKMMSGTEDDANWDIPDLGDLRMPKSAHAGYFYFEPKAGDTVSDWLDRIETLFGYSFDERCIDGKWMFRMFDPGAVTASKKTFYLSGSQTNDRSLLCWDFFQEKRDRESNVLQMSYCNSKGQPCELIVEDENDTDYKTGSGELLPALFRENHVREEEEIRAMAAALVDRPGFMSDLLFATWKAQYHPDLWPQDFVTIAGFGDYRIAQMAVDYRKDITVPHRVIRRECTYYGVKKYAGANS